MIFLFFYIALRTTDMKKRLTIKRMSYEEIYLYCMRVGV